MSTGVGYVVTESELNNEVEKRNCKLHQQLMQAWKLWFAVLLFGR